VGINRKPALAILVVLTSCVVWFGLAVAPYPAQAELLTGLTTANVLETFDSAAPGTVLTSVGVTGLQGGETLLGIDRRPANGALYGLGSTSRLYLINPTTGAATQVGSAGAFTLSGTAFGFDFNPTVDRIRVTGNTGQNLRLNPNDGTLAGTDTALAYAAGDPNAGATARIVGSAYTNNVSGATSTTLFAIDSTLNILATQGSPGGAPISPNTGQLFTRGGLGFDTSDLVGFDISGLSGIAFASLTAPAGNFSQLFTIDLTTGATTLVGTIGGGVPLTGLASAVGVPEPGTLLLSVVGLGGLRLVVWAHRRRRDSPRAA
jgi:Domain of unknown function (DUF4394)